MTPYGLVDGQAYRTDVCVEMLWEARSHSRCREHTLQPDHRSGQGGARTPVAHSKHMQTWAGAGSFAWRDPWCQHLELFEPEEQGTMAQCDFIIIIIFKTFLCTLKRDGDIRETNLPSSDWLFQCLQNPGQCPCLSQELGRQSVAWVTNPSPKSLPVAPQGVRSHSSWRQTQTEIGRVKCLRLDLDKWIFNIVKEKEW